MAVSKPSSAPDPRIDYRKHPELYRIGRGEEGVLTVEPYKSEILPHWRFKTPETAQESADAILGLFADYAKAEEFVGMDMARKFLQMGYTRSRRYARHRSGRKYDPDTGKELPPQHDPVKQRCADVFYAAWQQVRENPDYQRLKEAHQKRVRASKKRPSS